MIKYKTYTNLSKAKLQSFSDKMFSDKFFSD